jgi:hypothetical protein
LTLAQLIANDEVAKDQLRHWRRPLIGLSSPGSADIATMARLVASITASGQAPSPSIPSSIRGSSRGQAAAVWAFVPVD